MSGEHRDNSKKRGSPRFCGVETWGELCAGTGVLGNIAAGCRLCARFFTKSEGFVGLGFVGIGRRRRELAGANRATPVTEKSVKDIAEKNNRGRNEAQAVGAGQ